MVDVAWNFQASQYTSYWLVDVISAARGPATTICTSLFSETSLA